MEHDVTNQLFQQLSYLGDFKKPWASAPPKTKATITRMLTVAKVVNMFQFCENQGLVGGIERVAYHSRVASMRFDCNADRSPAHLSTNSRTITTMHLSIVTHIYSCGLLPVVDC